MKLYNTLSRQVEEIIPFHPPQLGVYTCGPTVYDYTHIGHVRKYLMDDVLIRTLKQAGFKVKHVKELKVVATLDSGEQSIIINDALCNDLTLSRFIRATSWRDLQVESLSREEFCQTWIVYQP